MIKRSTPRCPELCGPLIIEGKVKDKVLDVEAKGRFRREIPWNDKVLSLSGQERLFEKKKLKAGDK